MHNLVNKALALGLSINTHDISHLDFDRLYTIKAAYDEVMAAKMKSKR